MVRQSATERISFAASSHRVHGPQTTRHNAARLLATGVRLLVAPIVAVGVLVAGALYVILLPICGLASIAQALAVGGWRFVRSTPHLGSRARAIRE